MPPPLRKPFKIPSQETLQKLYRPPASSTPRVSTPSPKAPTPKLTAVPQSQAAPSPFYDPKAKAPPPSLSSLLTRNKTQPTETQGQAKHILTSTITPLLRTVRMLTGVTALTSPFILAGTTGAWIQAAIVVPNFMIAATLHIIARTFITKMEVVKAETIDKQFDTSRTDRLIRFTMFPQTRQITLPRSYITATGYRFQNIAIKEKHVAEMKERGWKGSRYFILDVTAKLEDDKWKEFVIDLPSRKEE